MVDHREFSKKDFEDFMKKFSDESDRAAVILGAAQLDILLYQLLQGFMLPPPSSNDNLLDSDRSLGTFSARIDTAYRLCLIDAGICRALHLIRKIRNGFAHETGSTSLEIGSHRDRIRELATPLLSNDQFQKFHDSKNIGEHEGSYRLFRACLGVICGRLLAAVRNVRKVEAVTINLIPDNWIKEVDS